MTGAQNASVDGSLVTETSMSSKGPANGNGDSNSNTTTNENQKLGELGQQKLCGILSEDFKVVPTQRRLVTPQLSELPENLPELIVKPKDLIAEISKELNSLLVEIAEEKNMEEEYETVVEVYGGVARSVIAHDYKIQDLRVVPTDLDLRFYIGTLDFDKSRDVVEKCIIEIYTGWFEQRGKQPPKDLSSIVRNFYFQKQVVVGSFSLLSIGDPTTGRNLDLEFCRGTPSEIKQTRTFFDHANAFVINLPSPAKYGWQNQMFGKKTSHTIVPRSLATNFDDALATIAHRKLNVHDPKVVVNGLLLYAHAICDKGLVPSSWEDEQRYGKIFVQTFLEQIGTLRNNHEDPLRFVKSFLRSHYPAAPLSALACLVQILILVRAYAPSLKEENQGDVIFQFAVLVADQFQALCGSGTVVQQELQSVILVPDLNCATEIAECAGCAGQSTITDAQRWILRDWRPSSGRDISILMPTSFQAENGWETVPRTVANRLEAYHAQGYPLMQTVLQALRFSEHSVARVRSHAEYSVEEICKMRCTTFEVEFGNQEQSKADDESNSNSSTSEEEAENQASLKKSPSIERKVQPKPSTPSTPSTPKASPASKAKPVGRYVPPSRR
eukprot:768628-Hanusia_phi.AAC.18